MTNVKAYHYNVEKGYKRLSMPNFYHSITDRGLRLLHSGLYIIHDIFEINAFHYFILFQIKLEILQNLSIST